MNLSTLACPKCGADMRTYERSGIHVDQCGECRGVFLDRGELERLMDAEATHYAPDQRAAREPGPPQRAAAPAPTADRWGGPARDDRGRDDRGRDARGRDDRRRDWDDDDNDRDDDRRGRDGRGRRRGFLGDVFEVFGE